MLILLPDAAVSVTQHQGLPDRLLVRAATAQELDRVFPGHEVGFIAKGRDLPYWVSVARLEVADTLATLASRLDYGDLRRASQPLRRPVVDQCRKSLRVRSHFLAAAPVAHTHDLRTGESYAHTTTRGKARVVYVHQVQDEFLEEEGVEPEVVLEFLETARRISLPLSVAQRWLRNAERLS